MHLASTSNSDVLGFTRLLIVGVLDHSRLHFVVEVSVRYLLLSMRYLLQTDL